MDDRLAVYRVSDGLTKFDVIEGRILRVEAQIDDVRAGRLRDLELRVFAERFDGVGREVRRQRRERHAPASQFTLQRRPVLDYADAQSTDLRRAFPISRVGLQRDDPLRRIVADELERARAERVRLL